MSRLANIAVDVAIVTVVGFVTVLFPALATLALLHYIGAF
jgi:hypothetical protein